MTTSALRRSLAVCRPHLRGQRALAGAGLLAMLAEVAMRLLEPWPVQVVVDAVVPAAVDGAPVADGVGRTLVLATIATVAVVAGRAVAAYLSTITFAVVGSRVTTRLRDQVYAHVLTLSMRFHDRARTGDLVVRLTGDVQRLQEVAVSAALPLLGNLAMYAGMTTVMFVLDPVLALVAIAAAPTFALLGRRSGARITHASRRQRRDEGQVAAAAGETLGAMKVVHSYGLAGVFGRRFAVDNDKSLRHAVQARRLAAGLERRTDVIVGLAVAVVLLLGGRAVLSGRLTPGELVVFLTYLKTSLKPMRDMAKYTGRIARAAASGERIADLLDVTPDIVDRPSARPLRHVRGDIALHGVSVAYEPGRPVVRDVDLHIRPGERVAVVGPSGAGKSTLVNLLLRLVEPAAGTVRIDGHDIHDVTAESVRRHVAVVLQDSVLFAATIAANIEWGRPGASADDVRRAARLADAHEFIERLPAGYDTVVGERGCTLSGGQRQRIAIARAILRDAPIVILDEPTSGLDRVSAAEVLGALDTLTHGRTTIIVAHAPALTAGADRIVEVAGGRVRVSTPAVEVA